MSTRIGILAGIPALLFIGWFLWTEVIAYTDFRTWEQDILESYQVLDPEAVSKYRAGNVDNFPGHYFRLTPRTEAQRINVEQFWKQVRTERLAFTKEDLDSVSQEHFDQLAFLEAQYLDMPWEWWAMNLFNPASGLQTELPQLLAFGHTVSELEDAEGYMYRVRELPERLKEALVETERVASAGWVMDPISLASAAEQLRKWANTPAKEQVIYRSFGTRLTRLDPTVINEYQELEYLIDVAKVLEEKVSPLLLQIADRLEALPARETGMTHLPKPVFQTWVNVLMQREVDLEEVGERLRSSIGQSGISISGSLAYPISSSDLLEEITAATAGILPGYPRQKIRMRSIPPESGAQDPSIMPGTLDGLSYPVVAMNDSARTYQEILDVYQAGLPGATWLAQMLAESDQPGWTHLARPEPQLMGWGMAALDLMQEKLLWFSRDSLLLSAYDIRRDYLRQAAYMDLMINFYGEAPKEDQISSMQSAVLQSPGYFLSVWIWSKIWQDRLKDCEWNVACLLESIR